LIAIDTSSFSAYLGGTEGPDVELVEQALAQHHAILPPVVLTELLSTPRLARSVADLFRALPLLAIAEGYWERSGQLRARIRARGLKAPLADALIAQSCLDHDVAIVSRDADFRHFQRAGLKLLP
jgi:predicted nucleic acid-binding protein